MALEKSRADILPPIVLLWTNECKSILLLGLSPGSVIFTVLTACSFAYFYIIMLMFAASADATVLFSSSSNSQNVIYSFLLSSQVEVSLNPS